ncbi:MAG: hypothetical protein ACRDTT_15955 [Pseudonocardiaceae bacterium]
MPPRGQHHHVPGRGHHRGDHNGQFHPPSTAPTRVGHYWIDLSRAWLLHGDRRRALESLQQARRIAPQLTRYHPQVHETVHILAARDARSTASLRYFAAWCGIRT